MKKHPGDPRNNELNLFSQNHTLLDASFICSVDLLHFQDVSVKSPEAYSQVILNDNQKFIEDLTTCIFHNESTCSSANQRECICNIYK